MIACAAESNDAQSILEALRIVERSIRTEQEVARSPAIETLKQVKFGCWKEEHVPLLERMLTYTMQAKGASTMSACAWMHFFSHCLKCCLCPVSPLQCPVLDHFLLEPSIRALSKLSVTFSITSLEVQVQSLLKQNLRQLHLTPELFRWLMDEFIHPTFTTKKELHHISKSA